MLLDVPATHAEARNGDASSAASTTPVIHKVSKTQWKVVCETTLFPQAAWYEDVKRHLDTQELKPKPTAIMVAEAGRLKCQPHNLMCYSDDYIRSSLFQQTQPLGVVVKVADWIAARKAFAPAPRDISARRAQCPLFGNLIFVFSDKAFAKAGLGDPKATGDLRSIRFW